MENAKVLMRLRRIGTRKIFVKIVQSKISALERKRHSHAL